MYRHNTAHVTHNEGEGQNSYTTINLLQIFSIFFSFFLSSNYFFIKWLANWIFLWWYPSQHVTCIGQTDEIPVEIRTVTFLKQGGRSNQLSYKEAHRFMWVTRVLPTARIRSVLYRYHLSSLQAILLWQAGFQSNLVGSLYLVWDKVNVNKKKQPSG